MWEGLCVSLFLSFVTQETGAKISPSVISNQFSDYGATKALAVLIKHYCFFFTGF